jgi:hypothetical protein
MLTIALIALIALLAGSLTQQRISGLTSLQEIYNNSSAWVNKEVSVEGRLYVYVHFGFIYQGVKGGPDYILVDNNYTQMPISSNGITMPISWSMENAPTVDNGTFSGPYALVTLDGIVKNTTAGDLGVFWPALYILTLNVRCVPS